MTSNNSFAIALGNHLELSQPNTSYLREFFKPGIAYSKADDRICVIEQGTHRSLEEKVRDLRNCSNSSYVFVVKPTTAIEMAETLRSLGVQIAYLSLTDLNVQRANFILGFARGSWVSMDGREITSVPELSNDKILWAANRFDQVLPRFESLRQNLPGVSITLDEHEIVFGNALERLTGNRPQAGATVVKEAFYSASLKQRVYDVLAAAGISSYPTHG